MLTEAELSGFLVAIVTLLLAAQFCGYLVEKIYLPRVVGEIFGGFLFGPSVLGAVSPELSGFLVPRGEPYEDLIGAFYWLGLALLMFTAGFRIHHRFSKTDKRTVLVLLVSATVVPFAAGWIATTVVDFTAYMGPAGNNISMTLIVAIAVAVTSIPVISKIFVDLGLIETRFARIVVSASMIQDMILWAVLAVATGLAGADAASVPGSEIALAVGKPLAFCLVGLFVGPWLLRVLQHRRPAAIIGSARLGYCLLWCFLVVAVAAVLEINVIFGALMAGIAFGSLKPGQLEQEKTQIAAFSLAFFVPLYFAIVGYRIDIPGAFDATLFLGFLVFSSVVEGACVFAAMRWMRFRVLTCLNFSVAMNTRGGPGIVLASITYSFGLIDERLFVTLVLTAIATSVVAGMWFRILQRRNLPLMDEDAT